MEVVAFGDGDQAVDVGVAAPHDAALHVLDALGASELVAEDGVDLARLGGGVLALVVDEEQRSEREGVGVDVNAELTGGRSSAARRSVSQKYVVLAAPTVFSKRRPKASYLAVQGAQRWYSPPSAWR